MSSHRPDDHPAAPSLASNPLRYYLLFSVGTGLVLVADSLTPLGVAVWLGYVLLLHLTQSAPHPRFPFVAAAVFTALVLAGFFLAPPSPFPFSWGIFNRVMASAVFWITAYIIVTRRQALDLTRAISERFRLLVEGVKDHAIFLLDPAGNIETGNSGAARLLGYKADEIVGQSYARFFRGEDTARGEPLRKDGSQFWGNGVLTALYDENGEPRGVRQDHQGRKVESCPESDLGENRWSRP